MPDSLVLDRNSKLMLLALDGISKNINNTLKKSCTSLMRSKKVRSVEGLLNRLCRDRGESFNCIRECRKLVQRD